MPAPLDLAGQSFGRLTVLRPGPIVQFGGPCRSWWCRCECGSELVVPQPRIPYAEWIARNPRQAVYGCPECEGRPCAVCGVTIPRNSTRTACEGECSRIYRQRIARESYERNRDKVIRRSLERGKRRRAEGDPVYAEQDRRKHARLKADPAKWEATKQAARERYAASRPRPEPRACEACKAAFTPKRQHKARFCSPACFRAARPQRRPAAGEPDPRECAECGAAFVPSTSRLTCSPECRADRRSRHLAERRRAQEELKLRAVATGLNERATAGADRRIACRQCGRPFLPKRAGQSLCSRTCRGEFRRLSTAPRPCEVCGTEFTGRKRTDKTCSEECRAESKRRRARARLDGNLSLGQVPRTCLRCGASFLGHGNAGYCSGECLTAAKAHRERERVSRADYRCTVCGKSLAECGDLKTHRYTCSDECRREAVRQRNRRTYLNRKQRGKT